MSKTKFPQQVPPHNPWRSGLFYLIAIPVTLLSVSAAAIITPPVVVPIVFITTLLLLILLGLLQLVNDGRIDKRDFTQLIQRFIASLPLLNERRTENLRNRAGDHRKINQAAHNREKKGMASRE